MRLTVHVCVCDQKANVMVFNPCFGVNQCFAFNSCYGAILWWWWWYVVVNFSWLTRAKILFSWETIDMFGNCIFSISVLISLLSQSHFIQPFICWQCLWLMIEFLLINFSIMLIWFKYVSNAGLQFSLLYIESPPADPPPWQETLEDRDPSPLHLLHLLSWQCAGEQILISRSYQEDYSFVWYLKLFTQFVKIGFQCWPSSKAPCVQNSLSRCAP